MDKNLKNMQYQELENYCIFYASKIYKEIKLLTFDSCNNLDIFKKAKNNYSLIRKQLDKIEKLENKPEKRIKEIDKLENILNNLSILSDKAKTKKNKEKNQTIELNDEDKRIAKDLNKRIKELGLCCYNKKKNDIIYSKNNTYEAKQETKPKPKSNDIIHLIIIMIGLAICLPFWDSHKILCLISTITYLSFIGFLYNNLKNITDETIKSLNIFQITLISICLIILIVAWKYIVWVMATIIGLTLIGLVNDYKNKSNNSGVKYCN